MSVILDFTICPSDDCKSLSFTETTGAYSINNLTGWGTPNEATSAATSATLSVIDTAGTTISFNLFSLSPHWPTTDNDQIYTITSTDLHQGNTKILDGLYKFTYTVVTETRTYTTSIYKLFYCNIQCCIDQMFSLITDPSCDCQVDAIAAASKANALLESLKKQANCGDVNKFNTTITILNKLCKNINCETCR